MPQANYRKSNAKNEKVERGDICAGWAAYRRVFFMINVPFPAGENMHLRADSTKIGQDRDEFDDRECILSETTV